jgi:glycosyltransferase A (GT-A) superfamily protein (DUF2064 family)
MAGASVVIMARAPRTGEVRRALEPLLGTAGCAALHSALIVEAANWARQVTPDAVHVAHEPPDSGPELRALLGDGVTLFPQNGEGIAGRLADVAGRLFTRNSGPLLVVWPDLPQLRPEHAEAALSDLEAGCDLVLGPVIDGGFYLVGLARPLPKLFALPEQDWRSRDVMKVGLAAVTAAELDLGILRAERALQRPADVRAALADPCLPGEIGRILRRGG